MVIFFSKKKGWGRTVFPRNESLFYVHGAGKKGSEMEPRRRVRNQVVLLPTEVSSVERRTRAGLAKKRENALRNRRAVSGTAPLPE